MNAEERAKLFEETLADCRRFGDRPVNWTMPMGQAMSICGALQLALRHPNFKDCNGANQVRNFVMSFQECIPEDFPAIKKTIALGFHPKFDRPSS